MTHPPSTWFARSLPTSLNNPDPIRPEKHPFSIRDKKTRSEILLTIQPQPHAPMTSNPFRATPAAPEPPIPDTPTDLALVLVSLRRLITAWRERASAAPEREARVYRQVEADLTAAITSHSEMQHLWEAIRSDLIRSMVEALHNSKGQS